MRNLLLGLGHACQYLSRCSLQTAYKGLNE